MALVRHKESIHSGQFMVSNFEAEDEDVEEDLDISETKVFNENCIPAETNGQNQFQWVLICNLNLSFNSFNSASGLC